MIKVYIKNILFIIIKDYVSTHNKKLKIHIDNNSTRELKTDYVHIIENEI